MSYQLKVIKDNPIGLWPLDELSGTTAEDISGCGNNGTYTGTIITNRVPLVPGGVHGTYITNNKTVSFPIVNDYYGSSSNGSIGDKNSLDNDFSVEIWFYPEFQTTSLTPIFADNTNGIGLFYQKGDVIFRVGSKSVRYTLPYLSKSHYLVGTYTGENINLYHDGKFVSSLDVSRNDLGLTNTGLTLSSGPTINSSDSFIIDSPAVYRYSLNSQQILSHFIDSKPTPAVQIVYPEGGTLFKLSDENLKAQFIYSYPFSKGWDNFVTTDIYYNTKDQSISLIGNSAGGSKTVTFTDYISIPMEQGLTSSKIEWDGDNGVAVETSIDGTNYSTCVNGQAVPQYKYSSFNTTGKLYIRFTLSTTDLSKYIPKLKTLIFSFYKNKNIYAFNSGDQITQVQDEYHLGMRNYEILSRDYRNGLRCSNSAGFNINTPLSVKTVEFFYTPASLNASGMVSATSTATNLSWTGGTVSKTNIQALYVNGVDRSSITTLSSIFTANELHHVVIVFTTPVTGDIKFNYTGGFATTSLYQNVAIYENTLNLTAAQNHYNLYISKSSAILDDSSITLTENAPSVYDNDWIVVQGV